MSGDARGGNDILTATGDVAASSARPPACHGDAHGGNDSLTATGEGTSNLLFGDARVHVRQRRGRQRPADRQQWATT